MAKPFAVGDWVGWTSLFHESQFGRISDMSGGYMTVRIPNWKWSVKRVNGKWLAYREHQDYQDRISRIPPEEITRRFAQIKDRVRRTLRRGKPVCIRYFPASQREKAEALKYFQENHLDVDPRLKYVRPAELDQSGYVNIPVIDLMPQLYLSEAAL